MSFIEIDLHKILVATRFPAVEMARNTVKGNLPFQLACIQLLFDVCSIP
jgi:hypothetical protein